MRIASREIGMMGKIGLSIKSAAAGLLCVMSAGQAGAAYIEPNHQFVVNGGFELTTNGVGELVSNTNATGWSSGRDSNGNYGYNFIFSPTTATTGVPSEYNTNLALWGPSNGANNGLKASPTGGNFLGADGAYHEGVVYQQIDGLIVGQQYALSFDWAGAQQQGFSGATTEAWNYGFANQGLNITTATLSNVSHGFTGWQHVAYTFTATKASDYLYFLAKGTPEGQPPFSLLDSVSLTGGFVSAAPDPATWQMLILGFGTVGYALRRRRNANRRIAIV